MIGSVDDRLAITGLCLASRQMHAAVEHLTDAACMMKTVGEWLPGEGNVQSIASKTTELAESVSREIGRVRELVKIVLTRMVK